MDLVRRLLSSPTVAWSLIGLLGAMTALTVGKGLADSRATATRFGPPRAVVVLTRDLPAGHTVSAGDVETIEVPGAAVAASAMSDPRLALGRTTAVRLVKGMPLADQQLDPPGGLSSVLADGLRAVAIGLDVAAPRLGRGDHVDVIAAVGEGRALVLAPAVAVLEVTPPAPDPAESVTVAVSAAQAVAIAGAVREAQVSVALTARPPGTRSSNVENETTNLGASAEPRSPAYPGGTTDQRSATGIWPAPRSRQPIGR
ncbi:MAG: SAF domain-containing protein [Acidimicrobiales bacterium]